MSLIDWERDDAAMLAAEDDAIEAARYAENTVPVIPTGGSLAKLIEELTHDAPAVHHERTG